MNGYLLDTDVSIFFLQGKFGLEQKIDEVGKHNCYVSEITIAELLFGAENSNDLTRHMEEVDLFEKSFKIIPVYNFLRVYAKEKARLRRAGTPIAEFDLLIGVTSVQRNLVMVTNNEKHFNRIKGIKIENWTKKAYNSHL